ncbi:hypothetical protein ACLMAJ_05715 [Nocardia sp. KC 131]
MKSSLTDEAAESLAPVTALTGVVTAARRRNFATWPRWAHSAAS